MPLSGKFDDLVVMLLFCSIVVKLPTDSAHDLPGIPAQWMDNLTEANWSLPYDSGMNLD